MDFRQFLTILRDLFMPQPRNTCPHCGGIRCIGACQFNDRQPVAAENGEEPRAQALPEAVAAQQPESEPTADAANAAADLKQE